MKKRRPSQSERFPSAKQDASMAEPRVRTRQTESSSYRLAYADAEFLLRDALRPVRLQLELLKPELILQDQNVRSTIVVFGSARIPDPDKARKLYEKAVSTKKSEPENSDAARQVLSAKRMMEHSKFYEEARRFARIVSEAGQKNTDRQFVVVTGGGPGIMEAANRGADEVNAVSIGMNIVLPKEQAPNPYITPELCFQFHYFALRKMHFLLRARALVIFPGGFGTLDELFETLTLIQTGKIEPIPVLLFGASFWRGIIDFERMAEEGIISPEDLNAFRFVESAEEAWQLISECYAM